MTRSSKFLMLGLACLAISFTAVGAADAHAVAARTSHARLQHVAAQHARCAKHRFRRHHRRMCRHEGGLPTHPSKLPPKPAHNIGGAVAPDQFLPFDTGARVRVSQGAQAPCGHGYDHAPTRCNGYFGPYNQYAWDFAVPTGTTLHAAIAGTVVKAGPAGGGYGNTVLIRTARGDCSRFEHMSQISVHVNQPVNLYDVIGKSGSTGNSTGPHLHYGREDCRTGYSLPSSFIDAGDPPMGGTVTSGNRPNAGAGSAPAPTCPPNCNVYGAPAGVNVRKGPSTSSSSMGVLANGTPVTLACQTRGDTPVGGSYIWDQLSNGGYVADYYVNTPVTGGFSPGIGQCGAAPPAGQNPPPPPPPSSATVIQHYNCANTPNAFGHYVPASKHWGNDFVTQGSTITGGYLLVGANTGDHDHTAHIGIYTGGPNTLSGELGGVNVQVSGYGGANFTFPQPIAVSPGQHLWLAATGIGDFTAYDQNNGGSDGCFIGRLDGTQ